ncbi:MAG: hypothetical protein KA134_06485, partial [Achromobacter sp.]|nr:hypothetical protein [Achromobacter sp.]
MFTGSSSGDLGDGQRCAQVDPAFDKIPDGIFRIHDPFPVWLNSALAARCQRVPAPAEGDRKPGHYPTTWPPAWWWDNALACG